MFDKKAPQICGAFFMAGIYIHIPFCLSKCAYCGFYSVPSVKRKTEVLESLKQEMVEREDYLHGEPVGTIYFGGGTPSLLKVEEIGELLQLIKERFEIIIPAYAIEKLSII